MTEHKLQIHALHLGQRLAVAVVLSLMLLIISGIELGVAIRQSDHIPPNLDVSLRDFRLLAYTTDPSECQSELLCPRPPREYQVIWVVRESAPEYLRETSHRILSVPLL